VGCGTGALSQIIFEYALPNAIKGINSSADFIAYANAHFGRARVTFEVGEAQALPIESASFDAVVSGLVLNFVPQPRRAVAEMARAARSGGAVAAYVWDYADKMELIRYFWDAAVSLDPGALELDEGRRFPICKPSSLTELFEGAGLQTVEAGSIDIATRFRDFDDYWSPFLGGQGPAPGYAMSLSDELRGALRERIRSILPIAGDGSIPWRGRGQFVDACSDRVNKLKGRLAPSLFLVLGLFNSTIPGALFRSDAKAFCCRFHQILRHPSQVLIRIIREAAGLSQVGLGAKNSPTRN
jgi:SAM-dependent methyltransferase